MLTFVNKFRPSRRLSNGTMPAADSFTSVVHRLPGILSGYPKLVKASQGK